MSVKKPTYDDAVYDLAESFLQDSSCPHYRVDEEADELAEEIQELIERFIDCKGYE